MWGPGLKLHVSLTAALEGVELSASHFCHFMPLYPLPPESATSAQINGRLGGPHSQSGHCFFHTLNPDFSVFQPIACPLYLHAWTMVIHSCVLTLSQLHVFCSTGWKNDYERCTGKERVSVYLKVFSFHLGELILLQKIVWNQTWDQQNKKYECDVVLVYSEIKCWECVV